MHGGRTATGLGRPATLGLHAHLIFGAGEMEVVCTEREGEEGLGGL